MNVCSLELSKQLWELSGWDDLQFSYALVHRITEESIEVLYEQGGWRPDAIKKYPAYDLGYLLRKLPPRFIGQDKDARRLKWLSLMPHEDFETALSFWMACYRSEIGYLPSHINKANTPEDAACKLAIELFHQAILKRKGEK